MSKYTEFLGESVEFVSSSEVTKGVICDVYNFVSDNTKDLGIIYIEKGYSTPKQKILKGKNTVEGLISGTANFLLNDKKYICDNKDIFELNVGDTMQWEAITETVLYEVCYPPYEDGRFQNL